MVTGIVGMLTELGEHFWLVVIACIEVAAALLFWGAWQAENKKIQISGEYQKCRELAGIF